MSTFIFVPVTGLPKEAESKAQSRLIRRQAMHSVAKERRNGGWGQINRRQLPVFLELGGGEEDLEDGEVVELVASPSSQNYEAARISYEFDLLALSSLTSVYLSPHSVRLLSSPFQLRKLISWREASWLDFVPARYGESRVLQAAVDCTMAQARRVLFPGAGGTDRGAVKLYLSAIGILKEALGEGRWAEGDVLGAMQLLAFYEFLQFSESARWLHHISGMRKLIKLRGAGRFETEIERQMLMAQTGTIFHESMLLGEDCFLEEPEWKDLLSLISHAEQPTTTIKSPNCHPMISSLWIRVSPMARLFRKTTAVVTVSQASDPGTVLQLILESYQARQNLLSWREEFTRFAFERYADRQRLKLRELLGVSLAAQTILNRLVVALEPRAAEALALENETQAFAEKIVALCNEAAKEALPTSDLLLAQKMVIAEAAKVSEDDWRLSISGGTDHAVSGGQCVPAALFEGWCNRLGRRDPTS